MITRIAAITLSISIFPFALQASDLSLEEARSTGLRSISIQEAAGAPAPVSVSPTALPATSPDKPPVKHTSISNLDSIPEKALNETYQLGDEWGKRPVSPQSLARESAIFQRAAKATARFGGGTSFYLGKFNGHHIMATNNHVMRGMSCFGRKAGFVLLGKSFTCEKHYGSWKDIDLALFSIKVSAEEEALLSGLGGNFAYEAAIYPGQELLTVGFGVADNPQRLMMANQDSDCKVFSGKNEFRKLADPDRLNTGPDKVWSFANGCDISHGDSGSSYVDRNTGEVLGIVWTGRIPKSPQIASSAYLDEMLRSRSEEIWVELSYTVPAAHIRSVISSYVNQGTLNSDEEATLRSIISGGLPVVSR